MDQKSIGATFRKLRKENNYTVKEVTEKLQAYDIYIAAKSIYTYETGKRGITADLFLALCDIYGCTNILSTFGMSQNDYVICSGEESRTIERYRMLSDNQKDLITSMIDKTLELDV